MENLLAKGLISERSQGLIYLFLATRFQVDEHSFSDCVTDGGNDLGVDAVYIAKYGERPEIHAIQSKFHSSERKAGNPFKGADLRKFRDFIQAVKNRDFDLSKIANPIILDKIEDIRELLDDAFPIFRVWCISNGSPCVRHDIQVLEDEFSDYDVEISEFHLEEFHNHCFVSRSKRTDHSFICHGKNVITFSGGSVKGVTGLISAKALFNLIKDITDPGRIDYGLFDKNIRGFLGSRNEINRQIYRSAVSKQNDRFWCLNNGITMTCSKFEINNLMASPKVLAKRLSIVNGAQTCGAIFEAINDYEKEFSRFENLTIGFRLYETSDPTFVDDIAISSNSQNRVNSRDLKANHEFQINIEQDLAKYGITYLRKRGQTEGYENLTEDEDDLAVSEGSIDALKVGQIILAYFKGQPERAKRDSDQIFGPMYRSIFAVVDVEQLVFAIRLYWKIMSLRALVSEEIRIKGATQTQRDFITYGVFHVLFTCGWLLQNGLAAGMSDDQLIEMAVERVEKVIRSSGNPAYYIFFRRPKTVEEIREFGLQPSLFDQEQLDLPLAP